MMLRDLQPWLASEVLFPVYHYVKRDGMLPAIKTLVEGQWRSTQALRQLQESKLAALFDHCRAHVPYYKNIFNDMSARSTGEDGLELLQKLPFLTKEIIRQHMDELRAGNVSQNQLVPNSTSGSTGEPMRFFHDRKSAVWRGAVVWRNQEWMGARISDREVRLWGAQMDIRRAESLRGRLHSALHQKMNLSSYDLSDSSMFRYVEIIRNFKPRLLISYASPLATLAEFIRTQALEPPELPAILTSAETLYPWQRELIESVFGTRIFDRYGCREFGNIAHQCEMHDGYHVNIERFMVEIVDPEGNPVRDGEIGEIVITDLDNYGFPFLRYRIGDLGVATSEVCACGRGLPLIKRFEGRSFDIIVCPNGQRIAGTFWTIALRQYPGVRRFQVVQTALDHLLIRLVIDDEWNQGSEAKITRRVKQACGEEMSTSYEYLDSIKLTTSGKQRLVINELHHIR